MPLGDLFKSKEELEAELKKQQKREMRDATRSVDRIVADLDRQAKDLEAQIKTAAAKNDTTLAKTLAKHLIKVRGERVKAVGAKSKIGSISSQAASMQTTNKLAQVMANSASTIAKVNQQMNPEQLAQTMNQFQSETMKMDMGESAMNDMFDELFEGEDEEADAIMDQVLGELAIETSAKLSKLPAASRGPIETPVGQATSSSSKQSVEKSTGRH